MKAQSIEKLQQCGGLYFFLKQITASIADQSRYDIQLEKIIKKMDLLDPGSTEKHVAAINKQVRLYADAAKARKLTKSDLARDEEYCIKN